MSNDTRAPEGVIEAPHPFLGKERFESLDVLRGVALLGIFAMNVMTFAMPFAAYWIPNVYLPYEGVNVWTYRVVHVLFDLKMMTLFSMLFGAGVIMYARKADPKDKRSVRRVRRLWLRRNVWLLVIGLVHAYLIWEGDILVAYAIVGLVLLWWLRRLPAWAMLAIAAVLLFISQLSMVGWAMQIQAALSDNPHQALGVMGVPEEDVPEVVDATREMFAPTDEQIGEQVAAYRGGYTELLPHRAEMSYEMHTQFLPFYLLWRVGAMMLLGAALTKLGLLTGRVSNRACWTVAVCGYAVGLPLVIGGIVFNESRAFEPVAFAFLGTQFNGWGSVPVALGHAGLIVALVKLGVLRPLMRALAAVGRMALTNYLAQSVIGSIIFYGYGFALYGAMNRLEQELVVLAVWVAMLVWSPLWLARFRFGPVEWLWRTLTYMKVQPMARRS